MLTVNRISTLSKLTFPIAVGLSSTLVLTLINLSMVGKLGNIAVAAVGLSSFCYTLIVAFVLGVSPAVQGIVARRRGERSQEAKCLPLSAGLTIAVAVGAPLTLVCHLLTPYFFSVISSDSEVTKVGTPYLQILYLGIVAVGMNGAFRGFWTGIERPRTYMFIVLMMSCLDAFLNYTLIFGHFALPALGVKGAAIGTVVSLYAGLVANVATALPRLRADGFSSLRPGISLLGRIVKLGVPATMQEFFFSAGYVAFFWMVGQVGTAELAAANVLVRVTLVLILLAMALGMASATLVSKTVGQGDLTAATEWGWDAGKLGVILITLLGVPLFVFPERFLSFFLSDPHTVGIAVIPLRLVAATTGLGSLIYIFAYILYSLGDGNRVTLVSFSTQWLFFLPVVWIVGPHLRHGLLHIWLVQIAYGTLATVLVTAIWMSGRWKRISI